MRVLTIKEIQAEYKVCRKTATEWAKACGGAIGRKNKQKYRVDQEVLDRWLRNEKV